MIRQLRCIALSLTVLGLCATLAIGGAQAAAAGFRDMNFTDAERGRTIPVALWYPNDSTAAALTYGGIHARRAVNGGAIAPGRHPLALLSHGTGGRPNLQNLFDYCASQPAASLTCPTNAGEHGEEDPLHIDFMSGGASLKESRLRALVVAAPAIGPLFDAPGLVEVYIPVLIFWAGADAILNEPDNSRFYLDGIAQARGREMPGIGHFTFLSECSNMLRTVAPQICTDPDGISRAEQHNIINAETLEFLERHLAN